MRQLPIKSEAARRLRAGHLWIFANEVDGKIGTLGFGPGECVEVVCREQRFGVAYVNPATLIAARLLQQPAEGFCFRSWLDDRIGRALALRARLGLDRQGRLIFGESDGLPGLVVDRYDALLSVQISTAGMEAQRGDIAESLLRIEGVSHIVWRDDLAARGLEGLPMPPPAPIDIDPSWVQEGDARFLVSPVSGQKTGWFFDQRDNRARVLPWLSNRRILDLFCYGGGWGIGAACRGAHATCVDSSGTAIEAVRTNALASGVADRVVAIHGDAFEVAKTLRQAGERFDAVVVDPPAFIKRKKDFDEGALAYRRINEAAIKLLDAAGLLVSCSCSHHFDEAALLDSLRRAALASGRRLRVLMRLQQSADHPVLPAMPETSYLKGFVCAVD